MELDIKTEEIKEIVLDDNTRFSYTIKQVEITNILGTAVTVLDEYFITNSAGEIYQLYKTKEGICMMYQRQIMELIKECC